MISSQVSSTCKFRQVRFDAKQMLFRNSNLIREYQLMRKKLPGAVMTHFYDKISIASLSLSNLVFL